MLSEAQFFHLKALNMIWSCVLPYSELRDRCFTIGRGGTPSVFSGRGRLRHPPPKRAVTLTPLPAAFNLIEIILWFYSQSIAIQSLQVWFT